MPLHLARWLPIGFAVPIVAAALACSDPAPAPDAGPPSLELGTGNVNFEPLQEGGTIFIVQGPQGGYHFFGSLQARNIEPGDSEDLSDPNNPQTTFEAYVGDTRVDAMASSYRQGLRVSNGVAEMIGRQVILDILDDDELAGATVRFVVSVEDAGGIKLSDERTLMALPHPDNQ